MKRGFTLLEILIVIVIIGVMATLGLTQYNAVVERSRGAEARQILGQLRSLCAGIWMGSNDVASCNATNLSLSTSGVPLACQSSHYFYYNATPTSGATDNVTITAIRCTSGGKNPDWKGTAGQGNLTEIANFTSGNVSVTAGSSGPAY